jgi:hypothetical protein
MRPGGDAGDVEGAAGADESARMLNTVRSV